jgi:hypothetical protein
MKQYTLIQFTRITKVGRRVHHREPCWLKTAAFADGPGMVVKKMTTTTDLQKAARFSLATAHDIAVQFSHLSVSLVRTDGMALVAESETLRAEQSKRHSELRQFKRELNEVFASCTERLFGGGR